MKNFYGVGLAGKSKVVIIESNELLLQSYNHIFQNSEKYLIVGLYASGGDALKELNRKRPDVIVTDIHLADMSGYDFIVEAKEILPKTEILVLTSEENSENIFEAFKAGASGYITKSNNYLELIYRLDELIAGGAPLSGKVARILVGHFYINRDSPLSSRETQVLTLLSEGKTYTQISAQLGISKETSKKHIQNIYGKLNVNKKSEALELAASNKFI